MTRSEAEQSRDGITPEPVTGVCVTIEGRIYPVMQVGEVITRRNRRDFTSFEMRRALTRLGFTCHDAPPVERPRNARADEDALGW
ncbi:SCO5918 family protein [Streptomyces sp. NPDC086777]|uniref:SCO5918 family protein n=1 Tax=Streptomyces sp. NPDC086777 TaxID=3154866 RepID=UPI00344C6C15